MKIYKTTTVIVDMLLECAAANELLVCRLTQLYSTFNTKGMQAAPKLS